MQTVIRRHAQRPDDAVLVVRLLDDGLQCARHADSVAAHDRMLARTIHVQERRVQRLAVFRAKLENVADLNRAADLQRLGTFDTRLARADGAQIKPRRHLDVALDGDTLQMETVLIRARSHVIGTLKAFVGINFDIRRNILRLPRPSEPGFAPSSGRISSTVAGRTATAPVFAANFVSFN